MLRNQCRTFKIRGRVAPIEQVIVHHTALEEPEQLSIINETHKALYPKSTLKDTYVCYHYFIGTDGTLVALRNLFERTGCTRNQDDNLSSIHVVLAGNFTDKMPDPRQMASLKRLLKNIDSIYPLKEVIGHREASPTACPGEKLEQWLKTIVLRDGELRPVAPKKFVLSRYYTPVRGQKYYYRDSYEADFKVNCLGDCLSTASSKRLNEKDAYSVVACPPKYPFGTKFIIEGKTFTCWDRGGAIVEDENMVRLDIWSGIGVVALERIKNTPVPENPRVEVVLP